MQFVDRLITCAVGAIAASAISLGTAPVRAQTSGSEQVHVCASSDGGLRLAADSGECPAGHRTFVLAAGSGEIFGTAEPPPPPSSQACEQRAAALAARIDNLEKAARTGELGQRATAPFTVTDRNGKKVLTIDTERTTFFDRTGHAAAWIAYDQDRGSFHAVSSGVMATIGASRGQAGLMVLDRDAIRVSVGRHEAGNYSARFHSVGNQDAYVAAIGQTTSGIGSAWVGNAAGQVRAVMAVGGPQQSGIVQIVNNAGQGIASLLEGANGGGLLTIAGASGERMVDAGVTASGIGLVRTGPGSFMTAAGLGLPGSYIMGKR